MLPPSIQPGKIKKNYTCFSLEPESQAVPDSKYICATTITNKNGQNYIYLGTADGSIVRYTYQHPEINNMKVFVERKIPRTSRSIVSLTKGKEVRQLAVIPDPTSPQLIALCNEKIHLIKGDQVMTIREFTPDVSMDTRILSFTPCMSMNLVIFQSKQKPTVLYLYRFRQTYKLMKTFQLSEEPTSMYLFWPVLIVSMKKEGRNGFYFIDCELESKKANPTDGKINLVDEKESITNFGKARPQVAMVQHFKMSRTGVQQPLEPEYILVVEKEGAATGYFVQYINQMPNKSAYRDIWSVDLKFQGVPTSLVVDEPFLISAQKTSTEVHSLLDKTADPPLPIASCNGLCFDKQDIIIFSDKEIHVMVPQPVEDRTKSLIDSGHIEEALHGYIKSGQFDHKMDVFTYAGDALFTGLKFEAAFNWYTKSGSTDYKLPVKLLRQFSGLSSNSTSVVEDAIKNSKLSPKEQSETLDKAKESLLDYLLSFKGKGKSVNELVKEIDESIVKLCAICRPEEFEKNLNTHKFQIPTEKALEYLTKFQRWKALATLYKYNKNYKSALEIWRKLGNKEITDNTPSPTRPSEETVYVLNLHNDIELMKEYSAWIYPISRSDFSKIWHRDKSHEPLPHAQVLEFLETVDQAVVIEYLEHIVSTLNVRENKYHTMLVERYCDRGLELLARCPKGDLRVMEKELVLPRDQIYKVIAEKRQNNLNAEADLLELRSKLVRLLQNSDYYDPIPILEKIKDKDEFISEKTELYSRSGNYKKALEILFHDLGDIARAENYCLQFRPVLAFDEYDEHTKAGLTVFSNPTGENPRFHALLDILLQKNDIPLAVTLLTRYSDRFDPVYVLTAIPDTVSLYQIKDFLSNSIKQTMNRYNHALVTRNLESAALMREQLERARIEKTEVKIDMDTTCAVTGEHIMNQISGKHVTFWRYPNGDVVAYDGKKGYDKSISPVTKKNFKENPYTFPQ